MDRLRTPLLILAIVLILIVVLIEVGTTLPGVLGGKRQSVNNYQHLPETIATPVASFSEDQKQEEDRLVKQDGSPGLAIPSLAFIDSIVLFTIALMGIALLLPERLQGRVQGIVTLVFSLLLIVIAFIRSLIALGLLLLMIALLLATPFGTIVYLIIYGSFNLGGTDAALGLILLLKFGLAISLLIAQQRFLQNKGLILLVLTSLLCNVIVGFLLGIVPGFLVSITDAIAAIIVGIVAIVWGIVLLIGSIISILKILRLDRVLKA